MKKNNILATILSASMLVSSFGGLIVNAQKTTSGNLPSGLPERWVKVYGDDFEGYSKAPASLGEGNICEILNAEGTSVVNRDWKYFGEDLPSTMASIDTVNGNSYITRGAGWRWPISGLKFVGVDELPRENMIEFDFGATAVRQDDCANVVYARINSSADNKSYYEIGHTGESEAIGKYQIPLAAADGKPFTVTCTKLDNSVANYNYPVWYKKITTVKNSTGGTISSATEPAGGEHFRFTQDNCTLREEKTTDVNGNTTEITYDISINGDYTGKSYFRVVKNDVTTYTIWGNNASGYAPDFGLFNGKWAHVSLKSTIAGGIEFKSNYVDGNGVTKTLLDGVCADTSLMGTGEPFMFASKGGERGARLDNFAIYSVPILANYDDDFTTYSNDKVIKTNYEFTNGKTAIATHPSGAKWVTSDMYKVSYRAHTAKFDNGISLWAAGQAWSNVYLELRRGIKSFDKFEMLVEGRKRVNGMSAFISLGENSMLVFGIGNENNYTDGIGYPGDKKPFAAILSNSTNQGDLKVVQQPDASFSNSENIKYTVERLDNKTIQWKAIGQITGATSGGILTSDTARASVDMTSLNLPVVYNAKLESVIADAHYGMGVFASGDGTSKATRARAWYTMGEEPILYDDFTSYSSGAITQNHKETGIKKELPNGNETGEYTGHRMASGPAVLGTNADSGAKWITSGRYTGSYGYDGITVHQGQAYIDTANKGLWALGCSYPHISSVNLDMGENKKVTEMHKVQFTMIMPSRNAGVRMFVSGNESFFLEFGFTGNEESFYGTDKGVLRAPHSPMIKKSVNPGNTDGNISWTSEEMNASSELLVYNWDAYSKASDTGIVREKNTSGASTVETTRAWTTQDTTVTYTIIINKDGTIDWTATGSGSGISRGTIRDDDVKKLINANWVYPVAFASGGDGATALKKIEAYGTVADISYNTMYEKKAYTSAEFNQMYEEADYGRDAQVNALLKLDLSNVTGATANANVNVTNENLPLKKVITGSNYEFADNYNCFYNENGTLKNSYISWAKSQSPISSIRLGGSSSNDVNMWNDLNGLASTYVSFPASNSNYSKIGSESRGVMRMGLVKTIKAFQANNPDVSFTLSVSPYTTTAEETGKLVNALIGTDVAAQTFRNAKFGSTAPINLYAIELGNEIDYGKGMHNDIIDWYLGIASNMITAIKANDSEGKVKIMACGPTAPWGSDSDWGSMASAQAWVNALINGTANNAGIAKNIDAMAFHTYYYGILPESLLNDYAKVLYNQFKAANYGNVKIAVTEHAVHWENSDSYYSSPRNSGLFGGLANAYFITKAANAEYVESGYSHSMIGTNMVYARWQYSDKEGNFYANPLTDAYNVLSDAWSEEGIYKTQTTVTNDVIDAYQNAKTSNRFDAATVKVSGDTINLIFVNNQGYTPVTANITLPNEFKNYKLTKKVTYTAPNMFSFMLNTETANLASVDKVEYAQPEVFGNTTYTVPSKSMVVLTLSGNANALLQEEFNYSNTTAVSPTPDNLDNYPAKDIILNSNGTKWVTSVANVGYNSSYDKTGSAKIDNGAIVINNVVGAIAPMSANWDVSQYKEKPTNINNITFTTTNTNANGGVMLFVKTTKDANGYPVESSVYNFSNDLCGLKDTISWTVSIAGEVLTWKAVSALGTKTGTMNITKADMENYDYLAQVYVNKGTLGSVALEKISVSYRKDAKKLIEYTKDSTALNITVNPSETNIPIKVMVAYYVGKNLVKITDIGDYAVNAASVTKNVSLPTVGQTSRIFVWNSLEAMTPVQEAIDVQ